MAVTGPGSSTNVPTVQPDQVGFSALTSDSFLKMLITQLQNQDPLEPMGNDELLNQLSMMRSLQSNIELSNTLKGLTGSQELSTASSFLGKTITGITSDSQEVTGTADRVFMSSGKVFLGIGNVEVPLSQIISVGE